MNKIDAAAYEEIVNAVTFAARMGHLPTVPAVGLRDESAALEACIEQLKVLIALEYVGHIWPGDLNTQAEDELVSQTWENARQLVKQLQDKDAPA